MAVAAALAGETVTTQATQGQLRLRLEAALPQQARHPLRRRLLR